MIMIMMQPLHHHEPSAAAAAAGPGFMFNSVWPSSGKVDSDLSRNRSYYSSQLSEVHRDGSGRYESHDQRTS